MNRLDDDLRALDPAPRADLSPGEIDRADRLLAAIVQLDPTAEAGGEAGAARSSRPFRTRRGPLARWGLVGGATVAGAGLLVGGIVVGTPLARTVWHEIPGHQSGLTSADLASWTAVPAHPSATAGSIEDIARACTATLTQDGKPVAGAMRVSDVDRRGSVVTLVITTAQDHTRRWCLAGSQGVVSTEVVDDATTPLPVVAAGTVNVQSSESNGSGAGAISRVYGQVGAGVTGVTLHTRHGDAITATVGDGLWTVWWPPADTDTGDLAGLTVTWRTSDGASHSASTDALSPLN